MNHKKKHEKKVETIKSKSLKTGDKKLNGPNRPST
ncbi:spore protein [Virgibacillus profundi]|nr:spore protein [Virgibacillus profundi]